MREDSEMDGFFGSVNKKNNPGFRSVVCSIFLLFVFSVSSNGAEFTDNLDEFLFENPGVVLQGFNSRSIPAGQFVNCNAPVNVDSNDDCFTPGFINPAIAFYVNQSTGPDFFAFVGADYSGGGNPPNVLVSSLDNSGFDVTFPFAKARVVGIDVGCVSDGGSCNSEVAVQVFGDGPVVIGETTIQINSQFNTFLGIEYSEPIRRVSIITSTGNVYQGAERVWFELEPSVNPIPTLSEWGMIAAAAGLAMIGAFYAMRRKRASA
jgi:hypothetical protein